MAYLKNTYTCNCTPVGNLEQEHSTPINLQGQVEYLPAIVDVPTGAVGVAVGVEVRGTLEVVR